MVFMFEKLQVYQKEVDFADEVTCASETFPRSFSLQIQGKYNGKGHNSLISLIAVILFSMKTIKNAGER